MALEAPKDIIVTVTADIEPVKSILISGMTAALAVDRDPDRSSLSAETWAAHEAFMAELGAHGLVVLADPGSRG